MQAVVCEELGARFAIFAKHGCDEVDVREVAICLTHRLDQAIGFLLIRILLPPLEARLDRNEVDRGVREFLLHHLDKRLEIRRHTLRRLLGIDVVVTGIEDDRVWLIGQHNPRGVAIHIGDL